MTSTIIIGQLTDENQLYLIDWDGAMIADPAIDLGPLLYHYVEEENWESWLSMYGAPLTDNLRKRMAWYVLAETVSFVVWHKRKGNEKAQKKCKPSYMHS